MPGLEGYMQYAYHFHAVLESGSGEELRDGICTTPAKIDTPGMYEYFVKRIAKEFDCDPGDIRVTSMSFLHEVYEDGEES